MSAPLFLHGLSTKHSQRGISLILLIFLIGLAATGFAIRSLSSGSVQIKRNVESTEALKEAKDAVVGYALTYTTSSNVFNPGRFPCAEDAGVIGGTTEGQSMPSCSTSYNPGRLAWRSLNLGDLRDGNNDSLWYALSPAFNNSAAVINSNISPTLGVDGVSNSVIAIIFSPGSVLSTQSRPTFTTPSGPTVTNYLDGSNSDNDANFVTGTTSTTFNDKSVTIKPDDIFPVLEKQVLGDIKNYLVAYKAKWHAYPFPAPFSNPSATYLGSSAISGGLLPIADAGISWAASTWSSVRTSNGSTRTGACTLSAGNQVLTCNITGQNYSGSRTLTINANLNKVGLSFYKQMTITNTSDFTITPAAVKTLLSASGAVTYSLNSSGGGTVKLLANPTTNTSTYRIVFKRPPQFDDWNTSTLISNYIYKNNWQQLIYYKVASPYLPGGIGSCGTCLTVNRIDVTPNTSKTNVAALLVSAGRKLDITNARPAPTYGSSNPAQSRPGSTLADYFDSANNTTANLIFESTNLPFSTFNDQVEVVE
jgi:hypothetical protein